MRHLIRPFRWHRVTVKRILVVGPGGSGKSTLARALSEKTGFPCTELDAVFWSDDLRPTRRAEWIEIQRKLTEAPEWILDGDLGPYDALEPRLQRADTVVMLDFPTWLCAWRAFRRSRQRLDFWRWLLTWRRRYRPMLLQQIADHAPQADLLVLRRQREVERLLAA